MNNPEDMMGFIGALCVLVIIILLVRHNNEK